MNSAEITQRTLKLQPTKIQEATLDKWLWHLTGVWNWAVRKIELDARDGIVHTRYAFKALLNGHSARVGIPVEMLRGTANTAYSAWQNRFRRGAGKPRLKGQRNKLNSIPFPKSLKPPAGNRITVVGESYRFHRQELPEGRIIGARFVKRASGWYLSLFLDAAPNEIPHTGEEQVGIDPGFKDLLTLSSGEKIAHPRELEQAATRLAQAQRGRRKQLTARLKEREANRRKDRNHKLSRRLVSENACIVWSKDSSKGLARMFGKSVASSGHAQLRQMLAYKCTQSGRRFVEVPSRFTTKTCSACGSLSGPTGYAGLSVRQWDCGACGAHHDRDVNAAVNTLIAGVGTTPEPRREAASGIAPSRGSLLPSALPLSDHKEDR